jgi:hypothetical protein
MADVSYSFPGVQINPMASMVKPQSNMSLGEVVNLARGAQQYQQEGIALTLEQQKEQERNRITEYLKRPENFQTEGRVDINKLNAEIPKIAPLTGADWMQKYTTLGNAQTTALQASQNLTQTQREMIASRLSLMGRLGVKDKRAYMAELDQLVKENPNNPDLKNLVGAYKTTIDTLPGEADLPSLAISGANSLLNPAQQQTTFAPQAGTASTGAATFPTVTQPSVAGEAPTITVGQTPLVTAQLPPGSRFERTGKYDMNNREMLNVLDASGRYAGTISAGDLPPGTPLPGQEQLTPTGAMPVAPQPGMQQPGMPRPIAQPTMGQPTTQPVQPTGGLVPTTRLPSGETPQTLEAANNLRTSSMTAAQQVPLQTFNNNQIIKLADDVITGKGASFVGNLTGGYAAIPFTSDNATNLNQLGHYMALQTASLANSSGLGGTDAARGIAGEISGTTSWTAPAIKQTARVNRALSTATDLFNQGAQNAFGKSNNPFAVRDFQNKWSQTVDINAVRLFDAIKNNDKDAIREVVTAAGGPNTPGYKRLTDNIGRMQQLIKGQ